MPNAQTHRPCLYQVIPTLRRDTYRPSMVLTTPWSPTPLATTKLTRNLPGWFTEATARLITWTGYTGSGTVLVPVARQRQCTRRSLIVARRAQERSLITLVPERQAGVSAMITCSRPCVRPYGDEDSAESTSICPGRASRSLTMRYRERCRGLGETHWQTTLSLWKQIEVYSL